MLRFVGTDALCIFLELLQGLSLRLCFFIPPVYACDLPNAREMSVGSSKFMNILKSRRIFRDAVDMSV